VGQRRQLLARIRRDPISVCPHEQPRLSQVCGQFRAAAFTRHLPQCEGDSTPPYASRGVSRVLAIEDQLLWYEGDRSQRKCEEGQPPIVHACVREITLK